MTDEVVSERIDKDLKFLVSQRQQMQKMRIGVSNRLSAATRGAMEMTPREERRLTSMFEAFERLENVLTDDIEDAAKDNDIVQAACYVKGVGPVLAARVIAEIDIERAPTVSALWRYAGYGVREDGTRDRLVKGEKAVYNKDLKTVLYIVAGSMLKSRSPYRQVYDDEKVWYTTHRPDWTKGHIHNAAQRKMIKIFLSHLWDYWREYEGLTRRLPYVAEYMEHKTWTRQEFGWPEVEDFRISNETKKAKRAKQAAK